VSFFGELKRRNVIRAAAVYLAAAWLVAQVAGLLTQSLAAPAWIMPAIFIAIAAAFPIVLALAWLFEITPEGVRRTADVAPGASITAHTGRKLDRLFVVIFGLVVVVLLGERFLIPGREAGAPAAQSSAATPSGEVSIAVLPFADLSPDKDQEYFADGVAEEILNSLARIRGLRVTGRTSSFYFKGRSEEWRTIGATLGAAHILEGSVRKSGDRVRVTAQLVETDTGYHSWSMTYERTLDDVFAIQDEIAMAVAEAVGVTLGVGDLGRLPGMTRNVEAYDELLLAAALEREYSPTSMPRAVEHLQRAIALDPSFAFAWLRLAVVYFDGALLVDRQADEWRRNGAAALEQARRLTPDAPHVRELLSRQSAGRGDVLARGAFVHDDLPRLVAEFGTSVDADLWGGGFLQRTGRVRESLPYLERARSIEPLLSDIAFTLGEAYAASGDLDAALAEFDRGLELEGSEISLSGSAFLVALATGDRALMEARFVRIASVSRIEGRVINEAMWRLLDDPGAALTEIRRLVADEDIGGDVLSLSLLFDWAAYYGDAELALELLRRVQKLQASFSVVSLTLWRPLARDVRKLPGFKDVVRDSGLVEYWRAYGWGDFCQPVGADDFVCQ
jgi:TolB-like protein